MKLKYLILLISILLSSCSKTEYENKYRREVVCNCEEREELKQFIQSSIKNANNMSDEEMEDVISELRHTGCRVICHEKLFITKDNGMEIDWNKNKLDSCESIQ